MTAIVVVGMMRGAGLQGAPRTTSAPCRVPNTTRDSREDSMHSFRSNIVAASLLCLCLLATGAGMCADIIVSAQDGKFVRVDGRATYPEPAPSDSLAVIDASQSPPVIKGVVEGLEHTVAGPPQAVAVTPDGKLAVVAAPTRYDSATQKDR